MATGVKTMSTIEKGYFCWCCGVELSEFRLPVSRRDECANCRTEIHVCKQCLFYDARVANACREDRAENVSNKEKANFCDYFKPKADAYKSTSSGKGEQARLKAESLFGGNTQESTEKPVQEVDKVAPTRAAREELKRLFGDDDQV
jgi:hypothetical protein